MNYPKFMNPPEPSSPILVAPREAARLLSISERTLWDLTADGDIPSFKIGRCVRYRIVDLQNWAAKLARSAIE